MSSLKQIKGQIKATDRTHQVTKAMEAVSAVKMRHSQERATAGRPYAAAALRILKRLSSGQALAGHHMLQQRTLNNVCLVVITSDKGLAGNLNSSVIKATEGYLAERGLGPEQTHIIAIGRKAAEHFSKRGYTLIAHYDNSSDVVSNQMVRDIVAQTTSDFTQGAYDACYLSFMQFENTFTQTPVVRTALPLTPDDLQAVVEGIQPGLQQTDDVNVPSYTFEPSEGAVVDALVPFLIEIVFYHAVLEAKASEHSARMVAMKSASDKSRERSREFTRDFNKMRQAVITREISEIVGGIEAMSQ